MPLFAAAAFILVPPEERVLRAGILIYAGVCVVLFIVHTQVGANAARLGSLFGGPVLALGLAGRRPVALVILALPLLWWQWVAPVRDFAAGQNDPSVTAAYYQPLIDELDQVTQGSPVRIEIPPTRNRYEANYIAPHFPLARGWLRQSESGDFDLFTGDNLTAASYLAWLQDQGVSYVALADADPGLSGAGRGRPDPGRPALSAPGVVERPLAPLPGTRCRWPGVDDRRALRPAPGADRLTSVGRSGLRLLRPGHRHVPLAHPLHALLDGDRRRRLCPAGRRLDPTRRQVRGGRGRGGAVQPRRPLPPRFRMLGIVLALGSSVAWGTSDFLGGLRARRMSALTVLLVSQPVGLVLAVIVALIVGGDSLSTRDTFIAAGAGATVVMALGAFYKAMALGSVTVVATIGALGVLVPVIGGLVQGDHPGPIQAVGAVAGIVGVVLVSREPDPEWRAAGRLSIGLAALAALGFGTFFLGLDLSSGPSPAWTIVAARTGGVVTLLVAAAIVRPSMHIERELLPSLVAIGLFDVTANSLFAVATNHGLLSLVAVAGSLYSAVTVLLARFVLGERLAAPQRAGVVVALTGVALIAAGA